MKKYFKRLLGYFIDISISFICYFLLFILMGQVLAVVDLNKSFTEDLKKYFNGISSFEDQLYTYAAFFFFLLLQDLVLKNKAIPRRILNLKLVNLDEKDYPGIKKLLIRNLIKALFLLDLVYFIFSRKILHDELSKSVVHPKNIL